MMKGGLSALDHDRIPFAFKLHEEGMLGTLRLFQHLLLHIASDFRRHQPAVLIAVRPAPQPIHQDLHEKTFPILLTQRLSLITRCQHLHGSSFRLIFWSQPPFEGQGLSRADLPPTDRGIHEEERMSGRDTPAELF